jgi:hypothetical protein
LLALPSIAEAAPTTNAQIVAQAKASPLFRASVARADLAKRNLATIEVSPGIRMDFQGYVAATALDKRADLAPLFDATTRAGWLTAAPTYTETVHELEDRVLVERRITIPLAADACSKAGKPQAVAELCLKKDMSKAKPKGMQEEIDRMRDKLRAAPASKIVKGTVTAAQALKMTDEQLFELLINTGTRTIQHVSIVPRVRLAPASASVMPLRKLATKLVPSTTTTGISSALAGVTGTKLTAALGTVKDFPTEYFLTGFTFGREIDDSWEYTIADETWLTDRYYVHVDYHIGLGFGLRVPFSVAVKTSSPSADRRDVALSVAPVNVDSTGAPAYAAVGLPASKTFGGKELVLELDASCNFHFEGPGPLDYDGSCPAIAKNFSRDVDPVIGSESTTLAEWWLDGSTTGLGLDITVASASLDIGLGASVKNGSIGMRVTPLANATISGLASGPVKLANRDPIAFSVTKSATTKGGGLRLDDPRYSFDVALTPKLRGKVAVDVWFVDDSWTLGPWSLDFLSISKSFTLTHHADTATSHDYALFPPPTVKIGPVDATP